MGGIPETQMVAKLSCRFHGMSLPHSSVHMTDCLMDAKLKIIPLSFQSICFVIPFISLGLSVSLVRWQVLSKATDDSLVLLFLNEKCFLGGFLSEVIDSS